MQSINQDMPVFDTTSIPNEYNPLTATLDAQVPVGDEKLYVTFKTEPVLNPAKSTKAGRPIFDDIDMVIIRTPGSQLTSVVAPIKYYMHRFGDKYNKWKATQAQVNSGTPLENFPFFFGKPSMVAELKALHVHTVEQLAEIPDSAKQRFMGGQELSRRAKEWLNKVDIEAAAAKEAATQQRIAELEKQLAAMIEDKQLQNAAKTPQQIAMKKG